MLSYVFIFLVWAIPIAAVCFFITRLCILIEAVIANKKQPGKYSKKQMKINIILFVVALIIILALVGSVLGFIYLMTQAIAYM